MSAPEIARRLAIRHEALVTATEGYAGAAPIIHKAAVVKAAIDALEAAFEEDRGENFP
jgi:hypothetical protein